MRKTKIVHSQLATGLARTIPRRPLHPTELFRPFTTIRCSSTFLMCVTELGCRMARVRLLSDNLESTSSRQPSLYPAASVMSERNSNANTSLGVPIERFDHSPSVLIGGLVVLKALGVSWMRMMPAPVPIAMVPAVGAQVDVQTDVRAWGRRMTWTPEWYQSARE